MPNKWIINECFAIITQELAKMCTKIQNITKSKHDLSFTDVYWSRNVSKLKLFFGVNYHFEWQCCSERNIDDNVYICFQSKSEALHDVRLISLLSVFLEKTWEQRVKSDSDMLHFIITWEPMINYILKFGTLYIFTFMILAVHGTIVTWMTDFICICEPFRFLFLMGSHIYISLFIIVCCEWWWWWGFIFYDKPATKAISGQRHQPCK